MQLMKPQTANKYKKQADQVICGKSDEGYRVGGESTGSSGEVVIFPPKGKAKGIAVKIPRPERMSAQPYPYDSHAQFHYPRYREVLMGDKEFASRFYLPEQYYVSPNLTRGRNPRNPLRNPLPDFVILEALPGRGMRSLTSEERERLNEGLAKIPILNSQTDLRHTGDYARLAFNTLKDEYRKLQRQSPKGFAKLGLTMQVLDSIEEKLPKTERPLIITDMGKVEALAGEGGRVNLIDFESLSPGDPLYQLAKDYASKALVEGSTLNHGLRQVVPEVIKEKIKEKALQSSQLTQVTGQEVDFYIDMGIVNGICYETFKVLNGLFDIERREKFLNLSRAYFGMDPIPRDEMFDTFDGMRRDRENARQRNRLSPPRGSDYSGNCIRPHPARGRSM